MTFELACALDDIADDEATAVTIGGIEVAIARDGDDVYVLQNVCSHQEVALTDGEVEDCQIECFLHGSRFDLRSGKPTGPPATEPVSTFPVEVRDGQVYVDTTTTLNGVTPT